MFKNYKDALFNDEIILKPQQRFKSDHHKVFTEEVNKIALSSNYDKRIQVYDKVTTYPYGINEPQVHRNESQKLFNNESQETFNNESQQTNESKIDIDNTQNEINEMGKDIVNKCNEIRKLKKGLYYYEK